MLICKRLFAFTSVSSLAFGLCASPALAVEQAVPAAAEAEAAVAAEAEPTDLTEAVGELDAQAPADNASDGEIVVTARKRSERLQDVPLSVAAVSGQTMQQQGIRKIEDLQTKVPNFKMTETGIGSQHRHPRHLLGRQPGLRAVGWHLYRRHPLWPRPAVARAVP